MSQPHPIAKRFHLAGETFVITGATIGLSQAHCRVRPRRDFSISATANGDFDFRAFGQIERFGRLQHTA